MLKFAIVSKIIEYFCASQLTIITGQRSFSSLADHLFDITPDTENSFEPFSLRNLEASLLNSISFQNISFLFELFTSKARKLKVAESNQAKAGLDKLWLAAVKAISSPVV